MAKRRNRFRRGSASVDRHLGLLTAFWQHRVEIGEMIRGYDKMYPDGCRASDALRDLEREMVAAYQVMELQMVKEHGAELKARGWQARKDKYSWRRVPIGVDGSNQLIYRRER